jgi:hypothetical protein
MSAAPTRIPQTAGVTIFTDNAQGALKWRASLIARAFYIIWK